MSFELDLTTLLKTICPRVFADYAPLGTPKPYIVWQVLGGRSLRFLDNTAADKRNSLLQVSVWSTTRLEATDLAHDAEDALCASAAFVCTPQGEPMSIYEEDTKLHGSIQRLSVYSSR